MHIVDTTLFFAPISGGVKRYLITKHGFLAAQPGIQHSIVVPGASDAGDGGLIEVPCLRIPFANGYRLPIDMRRWTDRLCTLEPDLIEAGDPYQVAWAALRAADRVGVPAVAFAHSDVSRLLGSRLGARAGRAIDAYLRNLYARFDLVMAPSLSVATALRESGIERVVVQRLGVDTTTFHPKCRDAGLRAELGLPADSRLLVYAGRIAAEKRIPLIRSTVEALGDPYHLLIVGGESRHRASAQVTLLAYEQDTSRLARLLASCDAMIHAGEHETFGLIFLEAMACGRPVIGVRSGAIPEIVDDDVGRLASPDDTGALAQAIESLYACDLDALGANARRRVEQRYSWQASLTQQMHRYHSLLRHGHVTEALQPALTQT